MEGFLCVCSWKGGISMLLFVVVINCSSAKNLQKFSGRQTHLEFNLEIKSKLDCDVAT